MSCAHAELASSKLKTAGANYLSHSLNEQAGLIALASPTGVSVLRCGPPSGLPQKEVTHVETSSAKGVISALALCPVAPELLATALSTEQVVRLWNLPSVDGAPTAATAVTLDIGRGACRQLVWHPMRRVLAVVTPTCVVLFDCSKHAAQASAPTPIFLELPEGHRSSLRGACWGGDASGGTLAAASESELFVFRWAVPGAWARSALVRLPFSGRQAGAIAPCGDALLVSLSRPITLGGRCARSLARAM